MNIENTFEELNIVINSSNKTLATIIFADSDFESDKIIGFSSKKGQMLLSSESLYVSTTGIKDSDDWRELGFKITKKLEELEIDSATIEVPENCSEFVEGLFLGTYKFDKYKSKKKESNLKYINLITDYQNNVSSIVEKAKLKIRYQFQVRDLVNTTPEEAYSVTIEANARKMFHNTTVNMQTYWTKDLKDLGMEGHLAVNRSSCHEACTIKLTYIPENFTDKTEHHVFVGKGLTYDSGGLSIKPASSMVSMKMDKAGAMTIWGLMGYLSKVGCKHKVTAYMCIAENMIDSVSYKPDDVLTMKNGKTVHVKNTDAEGRIVLFDNICLAQEQNDDITTIHTLATLTGAAVAQFGNEAAGLVGFNDGLKSRIKEVGLDVGEIFMDAAFHKYMMDGVDDDLADLSNTGTKNMGCQKAGLFLTNALTEENKDKFLHWDIAGPAYADKVWGTNVFGGTGFGVRTLIAFLEI